MNKKERPVLENLIRPKTTEVEKFQNEVIRPIVKMQHQLLVGLFKDYLLSKKINFSSFSKEKKIIKIQSIFKTDSKFKTFVLGCIVGQFSLRELEIYTLIKAEYNKRINQILTKRIIDSISQL